MPDVSSTWQVPYLGIKYRAGGRDRSGLDCWGLVGLVYEDQLGISLPAFDGADNRFECRFGRVAQPKEFDLALFDAFPARSHVGIVLDPSGWMLHASENLGVMAARITDRDKMMPTFYRWTQ